MKVYILKDIPGTAQKGDIKDVSDGYANNFLIARGLAKPATKALLAQKQASANKKVKQQVKQESAARKTARTISGQTFGVTAEASDQGKLFAAVTNQQVAEAIRQACGQALEPNSIHPKSPIKSLGDHAVTAKLPGNVTASFTIHVDNQ